MANTKQPDHSHNINLPIKTRIQLTLVNLITDAVRRPNFTLNRRLYNLIDRRTAPSSTPINHTTTHDVIINPNTNLFFRLFLPSPPPPPSSSLPTIIFFHGGGFAFLSAASYPYDAVCRRFCRKLNAVVCSVEYRLSPEHKFPTQYDDAFEVVKFIDECRERIGVWPEYADVAKCFIAGDSAGGNVAHHLTVRACKAKFQSLRVKGLINIQPFFGGEEEVDSEVKLEGAPIVSQTRTEWLWKAFLPNGLDKDHWAVNVSGPNALDITRLDYPPTILFVGGFDPLQDWQRRYYQWLKKSGKEVKLVEYSTAIHAFYVFPELPDSALLFDQVKHFIDQQCSNFSM